MFLYEHNLLILFLNNTKKKSMFEDLSGMMNKLKEAQQEIEKTKTRLNSVFIEETSTDNKIKITLTANSIIKNISIDNSLLSDAEELEDFLILTLNKALAKASKINEDEMATAAKSNMPNIPRMNMFK
jgi:DNA-binding protein YbaB